MSKLIKQVPQGFQHPWEVKINGEVQDIQHFEASNPTFGTLAWGQRPEGSVGWLWKENGGGGVGTVPYFIDRQVYTKTYARIALFLFSWRKLLLSPFKFKREMKMLGFFGVSEGLGV